MKPILKLITYNLIQKMNKNFLLLCLLAYIYTPLFGQYKVDTVIITEAYTSYINKELGMSLEI